MELSQCGQTASFSYSLHFSSKVLKCNCVVREINSDLLGEARNYRGGDVKVPGPCDAELWGRCRCHSWTSSLHGVQI